jgi:hypothetical protein
MAGDYASLHCRVLCTIARTSVWSAYLMLVRALRTAQPISQQQLRIMSYSRLIRFIPRSGSSPVIGEPTDKSLDVGLAVYQGKQVKADVYSGNSILEPGEKTGKSEVVGELLSPLAAKEVGTIRCIGLNVSVNSPVTDED